MTTVKEFKELGVPFVMGDKYIRSGGEVEREADCITLGWFAAGSVSALSAVITHFAWRPLNTIPDNPKFKYERTGSIDNKPMWRPLLDQSKAACSFDGVMEKLSSDRSLLTEFKHYEDDEIATQKPVFTKEFAVRCGVNVEPIYKPCIVKYEGSKYIVLQDKNGREYSRRKSKLLIRDIDTRTPKQKAVDDAARVIEMKHGSAGNAYKKYCETLYDAGLLK